MLFGVGYKYIGCKVVGYIFGFVVCRFEVVYIVVGLFCEGYNCL